VVARAFARLKHDGLIAAKGRTLTIPDARVLRLYAANAQKATSHAGSMEKTG
jgi:hypothetical protein